MIPLLLVSMNAHSRVVSYRHGAQTSWPPPVYEAGMPGQGPAGGGGGGGAMAKSPRMAGASQLAIAGRKLFAGIAPPGSVGTRVGVRVAVAVGVFDAVAVAVRDAV